MPIAMRYRVNDDPADIYDITARSFLSGEILDKMCNVNDSYFPVVFSVATIKNNCYYFLSSYDHIDKYVDRTLLEPDRDICRHSHTIAPTGLFWDKGSKMVTIHIHKDIDNSLMYKIKGVLFNIISNILNNKGYNITHDGNDLYFTINGKRKKFMGTQIRTKGNWMELVGMINLTVNTDIMELAVHKDKDKDGVYINTLYENIIGGLNEIMTFDVDQFFLDMVTTLASFYNFDLNILPATEDEILYSKKYSDMYKSKKWIEEGYSATDLFDDV